MIFTAILPVRCWSQQVDSLKKALRYEISSGNIVPDTTNVNLLIEIAKSFSSTEADSTLTYAQKAFLLSQKTDYVKGKLAANYQIGRAYFLKGNYQKVLNIADQSLNYPEGPQFKKEYGLSNQLAGNAHASIGSYKPGIYYFMRAKRLFEAIDDEKGIFQNLNNIGVVYLKLEDYEKALDIFLELDSLKILSASTIPIPVNLGFIYYKLGEYEKAEENLNRILNFDKEPFDQRAMGLSTFKLGQIYHDRGEYNTAIGFFNQSIEVYEKMGNDLQKVQSLNGIALTFLKLGNTNQALRYGRQAFEIAEQSNSLPQKNNSAETLYEIYNSQGNAEMALKYHVLLKTFSDSLLNNEISREVGRLEAKNEFEKRELALKEQQKQRNLENESKVAEQRTFLGVLFALFVASLIGGYSFYRNSQIRQKANKLLKKKNKEIQSQAEQLEELNDVKNHLFSIISHDLRGPISSLQGIISLHEMDQLSKDEIEILMPQVAQKFRHTSSLLTNLLSWSQSQLKGYQTHPKNFDLEKLVNTVLPVATHKAEEKNITVTNYLDHPLFVYADRSMMELVLLNLLTNAVKFTPVGGKVQLSAQQLNEKIKICVKDTGVGIPDEKIGMLLQNDNFYSTEGTDKEKGTGLGLILCRDFVEKNNGRLDVHSTAGAGSTFCFSIPAAEEEQHKKKRQVKGLA